MTQPSACTERWKHMLSAKIQNIAVRHGAMKPLQNTCVPTAECCPAESSCVLARLAHWAGIRLFPKVKGTTMGQCFESIQVTQAAKSAADDSHKTRPQSCCRKWRERWAECEARGGFEED